MRKWISVSISSGDNFYQQLPRFIDRHTDGVVLQSNGAKGWGDGRYKWVAGLEPICFSEDSWNGLAEWQRSHNDWAFGYITYEAGSELENIVPVVRNNIDIQRLRFFVPRYVLVHDEREIRLGFRPEWNSEADAKFLIKRISEYRQSFAASVHAVDFVQRVSLERYVNQVKSIQQAIRRGDLYEMNYCMEYYAKEVDIVPSEVFLQLMQESPAPFSAFLKLNNVSLLSASPERYLLKNGSMLLSQPIKGTAPRMADHRLDLEQKRILQESEKERAENIMITDLVRNDLSRIASKGSVIVTELCGIYSFRQVYQMISTIQAKLKPGYTFANALSATFPMGSMTGAPKVSAMQYIAALEDHCRGLYSGTVGYLTPEGDLDMNVVIRSLVYDAKNRYLSYMVGSAITDLSEPEKEYEECQWKAQAIRNVFNSLARNEGTV